LRESSQKLNQLESYDQLRQRAQRNGFRILSINYNGYLSSKALQDMQDDAIHARTNMRLSAEIEKQNNELANLQLAGQNRRIEMENQLGVLESEFGQKVSHLEASARLELDELTQKLEVNLRSLDGKHLDTVELRKLQLKELEMEKLKELQVDIDRYQCELNRSKNKLDSVYRFVTD
jgi:hypothetical protein